MVEGCSEERAEFDNFRKRPSVMRRPRPENCYFASGIAAQQSNLIQTIVVSYLKACKAMIKTTVYMATSINGFINDANGKTPWGSAEWARYGETLKGAGCLIVGSRTHEIMDKHREYERLGVNRVVVLTKRHLSLPAGITASETPQEALAKLEKEGFKEVIVGGGAETNAAFLKLGVVDEIVLDMEPFLFGHGLPLLSSIEINLNLQLIEVEQYSANSLGLKYRVLR